MIYFCYPKIPVIAGGGYQQDVTPARPAHWTGKLEGLHILSTLGKHLPLKSTMEMT